MSSLNALFRGTKVAKHAFYSIGTKTMVGSVSEHFANLWYAKRCKTCVAGLNALFRGTKVVKHPFYSIGFKMIFGSVSEYFANLRHLKRCNTCVRAEYTISGFQSCESSIQSIGTKVMFGSVSGHFANLRHLKRCKTCFRAWVHYFGVPKLGSIHSTPLQPKWYLGVFRRILLTFGTWKMQNLCSSLNALFWGTKVVKNPLYYIGPKMMFGCVPEHFANLWYAKRCRSCVRAWMHYFGVPKLRSIHSTRLEPKWCLGVFQSISLTFGT
jgi:hypothetical protein